MKNMSKMLQSGYYFLHPDKDPSHDMRNRLSGEITHSSAHRFTLRFIIFCALFYISLHMAPTAWFEPVNEGNAFVAGQLLRSMGVAVRVTGPYISLDGFIIQVIGECSALFTLPLVFAFFMSYPAGWRQRIYGMLLGGSVLCILNVFRILLVFLTGIYFKKAFVYVHAYLAQIGMVLAVAVICLVWLERLATERSSCPILIRMMLVFIGFSGGLFFLWIWLGEYLVHMQYTLLRAFMSVFNLEVSIPEALKIYPHTFTSLNLILFAGLVLSSLRINADTLRFLFLGLGLLMMVHMAFVAAQVAFFQYHIQGFYHVINLLLALQEWILPFILWFYYRHPSFHIKAKVS
jgi:exosortase/archaeosortase family protein